jgi:hypothetical protein
MSTIPIPVATTESLAGQSGQNQLSGPGVVVVQGSITSLVDGDDEDDDSSDEDDENEDEEGGGHAGSQNSYEGSQDTAAGAHSLSAAEEVDSDEELEVFHGSLAPKPKPSKWFSVHRFVSMNTHLFL